jgi:hypothetical protein
MWGWEFMLAVSGVVPECLIRVILNPVAQRVAVVAGLWVFAGKPENERNGGDHYADEDGSLLPHATTVPEKRLRGNSERG